MTLSCGPSRPSSPVFRLACSSPLGSAWFSAHDRPEFIKIWYEFAGIFVVFRSVLPQSYGRPRLPDVSAITFHAIFFGREAVGRAACPAGFAPLHQRQLSLNRRVACPTRKDRAV